jgi:hypothetical protein
MTEYPEFPQDEEPQVQREWYEKQIFDLKQLLDISKLLSANLDYGSLMDAILFTCMGQMKVLKAGLFAKKVIDHEHFTHRTQRGFDYDDARETGSRNAAPDKSSRPTADASPSRSCGRRSAGRNCA